MNRSFLKTSIVMIAAAILAPTMAAGQTMPRPWEPPVTTPTPATPLTISPFASKFKDSPSLMPSADSPWAKLMPKDGARKMDADAFPVSRAIVRTWATGFPALGDDFEVIEEGTRDPNLCLRVAGPGTVPPGTYNCIAHTTGINNVWVNPYPNIAGWDLFYDRPGYKRTAKPDTTLVKDLQKVAIYAVAGQDGSVKFTHGALQDVDGTWTSKLGSGPLIRHRTAESVAGRDYGEVVLVYVRKK